MRINVRRKSDKLTELIFEYRTFGESKRIPTALYVLAHQVSTYIYFDEDRRGLTYTRRKDLGKPKLNILFRIRYEANEILEEAENESTQK
jgi:hypothetical protein